MLPPKYPVTRTGRPTGPSQSLVFNWYKIRFGLSFGRVAVSATSAADPALGSEHNLKAFPSLQPKQAGRSA